MLADGARDSDFGDSGYAPSLPAGALFVDANNNIVMSTATDTSTLSIERLTAVGVPDTSFGVAGVAALPTLDTPAVTSAFAIASDALLVGGSLGVSSRVWAVELGADGTLATGFANAGQLADGDPNVPFSQTYFALAGTRIIAAETASDGSGMIGLAGFLLDGQLDTTFGQQGHVVTNIAASPQAAVGAGSGAIVVGGATSSQIVIARFLANGALDPSFGGAGAVELTNTSLPLPPGVVGMTNQADKKLIVAVSSLGKASTQSVLLRLDTDGSYDPLFGDAGTVSLPTNTSILCGPALQSDGRIVLALTTLTTTSFVPFVARFWP